MNVATRVKEEIKAQGLKQYAVADRAGINRKRFNDLLNGRKKFLADYLPSICRALGKSPDEILGYETENNEKQATCQAVDS